MTRAAWMLAAVLCFALAPGFGRAQDLRADKVRTLIADMKRAKFTVKESAQVPELTQPQQTYDSIASNEGLNWVDYLEGGTPVRLEVTSPSGRTTTVVYGLNKQGRGVEMDPREVAHLARSQNFGISDILGPNWRQLYPQIDSVGNDWDKTVALGNLAGLLYRPDPEDLGVPRIRVTGKAADWRTRGLPPASLRNRVSGAEFSYDDADADGAWVNNNNERLIYPGGADPYPVRGEATNDDDNVEITDPDADKKIAEQEKEEEREGHGDGEGGGEGRPAP